MSIADISVRARVYHDVEAGNPATGLLRAKIRGTALPGPVAARRRLELPLERQEYSQDRALSGGSPTLI
jgi:hypothetical protein